MTHVANIAIGTLVTVNNNRSGAIYRVTSVTPWNAREGVVSLVPENDAADPAYAWDCTCHLSVYREYDCEGNVTRG